MRLKSQQKKRNRIFKRGWEIAFMNDKMAKYQCYKTTNQEKKNQTEATKHK